MPRHLRQSLVWYAFLAPTIIVYLLFVAYPTLQTFRLSFFREVATQQEFVGALNFVRLLSNKVFFGAWVEVFIDARQGGRGDDKGEVKCYRIVGPDEIDPARRMIATSCSSLTRRISFSSARTSQYPELS